MTIALPAHDRPDNIRGILAMLGAMAVFVLNDTLVKIAAASLPPGQAIFMRGVFTTLFCAVLVHRSRVHWALPHALSPRILLRAAADVGGTILFLSALVRMPIGDVFGILQFTPLAITAAAAIFLGAKVGWRRWSATAIGLVGVLLIVKPGGAHSSPWALLVVLAMLCGVARDLLTRSVPTSIPSIIIVCASTAVVTLVSLGFAVFETWTWPASTTTLILVGASTALLAGQYWLVAAMRMGEIAVIAPFRYSIILWAILSGYVVWRETPDFASWVGIAVVTAAGLYTFLREQKLAKATRA
jgi:drug/metabolite transporter (DMT)-like permease